jgi:hypothetical protein
MLERKCAMKNTRTWCSHIWLPDHDNAPAHTSLKTTEFVTSSNMVIVTHHLYSLDLAPCDFALFPKLKMTSTVLLKHGKNYGVAVYIPKETILKEMAAKIE